MSIRCAACGREIRVPDDRAGNPRLRVKCSCGALFTLAEGLAVPHADSSTAPTSPAPVSAAVAGPAPTAPPAAGPTRDDPSAARPAPAAPAQPARVSFASTAAAGGLPRADAWRRCQNHPRARSASVCPACNVGYCGECENKVRTAVVCPACEGFCVRAAEHEERLELARRRARPMMDDLQTILSYPLRDTTGFVMLALFTWVFAVLGSITIIYGKLIAVLFSQGVLMAYCFTALSRVSGGNLKDFMPDIGDLGDLTRALRLGVAALVAGSGPLLVAVILVPGLALLGGLGNLGTQEPPPEPPPELATVLDQPAPVMEPPAAAEGEGDMETPPEMAEGEEMPGEAEMAGEGDAGAPDAAAPVATPPAGGPGAAAAEERAATAAGLGLLGLALWVLALGTLALVWKVVYTPVALTVAGLSGSAISTLNPVVGFDTIRRMGSVYWQAMGIYTVLAAVQWALAFGLGFIPLLGSLVRSFVDAYAYLAIGCTLGLAVFKKAPELGLD